MTKTSHVSRRITAVLAIVFLLPALIFFIMWSSIGLQMTGINEQEKMSTYIGYFPTWLKNITTIHIISIVCCVMAIILASRSFSKNLLSIRVLMLLTVVAALFILLFDAYQMVY
jgi:ABC-type branched-subunit amino acid transport system permease subunit